MKLSLIEGTIYELDRTTHVSGGGSSAATTTHMSMFTLSGERVILRSKIPAMINNGDQLKLAGLRRQGEFSAIACKNISTGWATKFRRQGCASIALITVGFIGIIFTCIFPLFIFMPVVCLIILILIFRTDNRLKKAHQMINQ